MLRLLPLALLLCLCPGCFVFDELDKGMAIMEQHTPRDQKKAPSESEEQEEQEGGSLLADLKERVVGLWDQASEPEAPKRDPDDHSPPKPAHDPPAAHPTDLPPPR